MRWAGRRMPAAGLVGRPPSRERRTTVKELAGTGGRLCRLDHLVQAAARRSHDRRRHRALDQGRIGEADMPVRAALEDVAHRDDRAAQVAERDHAVALFGSAYRVADAAVVGAQGAGGRPARRLDPDLGARHLAGQLRQPTREVRAVRYDYDADQGSSFLGRGGVVYSTEVDSTMSNIV